MNMTRGLSWLSSLSSRKREPNAGHEPADMGTAFGLDASLADEIDPPGGPADSVCIEVPPIDRLNRRSVI